MKIAKLLGCKEDRLKVDEHQVLRLPLTADLMRTLEDPDWHRFREVEGGRASRSRLRFPEDTCSFRGEGQVGLRRDAGPLEKEATNYCSVNGYEKQVRELFGRKLRTGGWSR